MSDSDRELRAHVFWTYLAVVVGLAAVSLMIGLVAGPLGSSRGLNVGAAPTIGPAASTATPTPTFAPTPTWTPVPPTAVPTASLPAATLTIDAAWRVLARETFDSVTTWPASEDAGWASGYDAGRYWLRLDGQRTISYSVPVDAPEFRVAVEVQLKSGYAGLLFLADESSGVYRLLVDDAGRYRLERQQAGDTTALYDWTASESLLVGADVTNRIEVQRVDDEIALFANDAELARYQLSGDVPQRGRVGITLDAVSHDTGALAYFDNLVIRVPLVPDDL